MPHKSFRIAIAGLGYGANVQAPALARIDGVEIVAIAGRTHAKARQVADTLKIPHAHAGYENLFNIRLDMVCLALPPNETEQAVEYALSKGVSVIAEKPLAATAEMARRLTEVAEENSVLAGMGFQFGELDVFKHLKAAVKDKSIGKIKSMDVIWSKINFAQKNQIWMWKADKKRHGGVLSLQGAQFFHLLETCVAPVEKISAKLDNSATANFAPENALSAEDRAELSLELKGGIKANVYIANSDLQRSGHRWEIKGEKGTLIIDNPSPEYMHGFSLSLEAGKKSKILFEDKGGSGSDRRIGAFHSLAERFITAVKTGKKFEPSFETGARVQELIEASRLSSDTGKAVKIK